jgi:phenylpropionate dioxygenase-like ring-hydroxylating dioxygenase large terminal subunit
VARTANSKEVAMNIHALVNRESGFISNDVFSQPLYERELERVFGKCWLFLGHDTLIPKPHDYFTAYMGEDSVIIQRDASSRIRVFLNKCRHRGTQLCMFDSGNASSFTCSYHGWTYTDGALTGMPFKREAYRGELDMSALGLIEVPRVSVYGGLIFACWDADAVTLEEYLGDACWYLDNFLIREDMGGLEIVPGPQRYTMPTNWKLLAENFAGDDYHFFHTHSSVVQLMAQAQDKRLRHVPDEVLSFSVAANHRKGAPHGFLELRVGEESQQMDLNAATALGPDCAEWVIERHRRLQERLKAYEAKPYSFHAGNIFPNFALIGVGTATYAKGLILHHPRGAYSTEVWVWAAVEKSAPPAMKERQKFVLMQRQAAAGLVAPDDHENFLRVTSNLRAHEAHSHPFHYGMALGHEEEDPRPPKLRVGKSWPGRILPKYSEASQRDFYRYWLELMEAES